MSDLEFENDRKRSVTKAPSLELEQVEDSKTQVSVDQDGKEAWGSRVSFILASIGSAIGLGNFWRFPFLSYKWGGGTFFIPYYIALFVLGIPLIQLELALGQVFRCAATQAFGRLHPRFRGIGLAAGLIAAFIVTYYTVILAWSNVMFVRSFQSEIPWSIRDIENKSETINVAKGEFVNGLLHLSNSFADTEIMPVSIVYGSMFMWATIYLILIKGQAFISKAVILTVLLPVVMLFVLVIVGATLPGARKGIEAYIMNWDMSKLSEGQMWSDAFGQIFFSLSLSTGVMSAYGALNKRNADIVKDGAIIAFSNCLFSFVAGFAVFSIAGYYSEETGIPLEELPVSGPFLAFVTFPAALTLLDGWVANLLCILFFLTIYFLGVDSAFSLVEAVVWNYRETKWFHEVSRPIMTTAVCMLGFIGSLFFCADNGLYLLDVVDYSVGTVGLLLVGFFECLVAGWLYHKDKAVERAGLMSVLVFDLGIWLAIFTFALLSFSPIYSDISKPVAIGSAAAVSIVMIAVAVFVSQWLGNKRSTSALHDVALAGPFELIDVLNETITKGAPNNWKFSKFFAFSLKFFMTPLLFIMNFMQIVNYIHNKGYDRGSYPEFWIQSFVIVPFVLYVTLIVVGIASPNLYALPKEC